MSGRRVGAGGGRALVYPDEGRPPRRPPSSSDHQTHRRASPTKSRNGSVQASEAQGMQQSHQQSHLHHRGSNGKPASKGGGHQKPRSTSRSSDSVLNTFTTHVAARSRPHPSVAANVSGNIDSDDDDDDADLIQVLDTAEKAHSQASNARASSSKGPTPASKLTPVSPPPRSPYLRPPTAPVPPSTQDMRKRSSEDVLDEEGVPAAKTAHTESARTTSNGYKTLLTQHEEEAMRGEIANMRKEKEGLVTKMRRQTAAAEELKAAHAREIERQRKEFERRIQELELSLKFEQDKALDAKTRLQSSLRRNNQQRQSASGRDQPQPSPSSAKDPASYFQHVPDLMASPRVAQSALAAQQGGPSHTASPFASPSVATAPVPTSPTRAGNKQHQPLLKKTPSSRAPADSTVSTPSTTAIATAMVSSSSATTKAAKGQQQQQQQQQQHQQQKSQRSVRGSSRRGSPRKMGRHSSSSRQALRASHVTSGPSSQVNLPLIQRLAQSLTEEYGAQQVMDHYISFFSNTDPGEVRLEEYAWMLRQFTELLVSSPALVAAVCHSASYPTPRGAVPTSHTLSAASSHPIVVANGNGNDGGTGHLLYSVDGAYERVFTSIYHAATLPVGMIRTMMHAVSDSGADEDKLNFTSTEADGATAPVSTPTSTSTKGISRNRDGASSVVNGLTDSEGRVEDRSLRQKRPVPRKKPTVADKTADARKEKAARGGNGNNPSENGSMGGHIHSGARKVRDHNSVHISAAKLREDLRLLGWLELFEAALAFFLTLLDHAHESSLQPFAILLERDFLDCAAFATHQEADLRHFDGPLATQALFLKVFIALSHFQAYQGIPLPIEVQSVAVLYRGESGPFLRVSLAQEYSAASFTAEFAYHLFRDISEFLRELRAASPAEKDTWWLWIERALRSRAMQQWREGALHTDDVEACTTAYMVSLELARAFKSMPAHTQAAAHGSWADCAQDVKELLAIAETHAKHLLGAADLPLHTAQSPAAVTPTLSKRASSRSSSSSAAAGKGDDATKAAGIDKNNSSTRHKKNTNHHKRK